MIVIRTISYTLTLKLKAYIQSYIQMFLYSPSEASNPDTRII